MKRYEYLKKQLDNENNLKVLLLSHNAFWTELQKLSHYYKNFELTVNGGSTLYLEMYKERLNNDYDLILFYSSEGYQENELLYLKNLAYQISNDNNKRVTIGYSYILPKDKRIYENIPEEIKLISFKDSSELEEITYGIEYFNTLDLTTLALTKHKELENTKTLKKENGFY